ncbi:FHA domain-containing protein [Umezawaea tangerina]|uniref:FHA domain-containing protein n=1 Tax=Umezawaea tangerina TaxID=84725 RepID=A0A2T0TKN5_9PSEU|nr:FHA domain-containing protein [Umezawaea tangerina]PRY46088.1 FHA domain-containing protein [Umezawaea tangerina]
MWAALIILTSCAAVFALSRHRGWNWDVEHARAAWAKGRRQLAKPAVSEMDGEYQNRRQALLHRIARAVVRLPHPESGGAEFVSIGLHKADKGLVGKDLIEDEREVNLLLAGVDGRRVRIREYVDDDTVVRGRVRVTATSARTPVPSTRLFDGEAPPEPPTASRRSARLVQVAEPGAHLRLPAGGGVIGRDAQLCQIVVDAPTVSRQHARIRPRADGFTVEDLDSANGMTINSRTTEMGVLHHGDILGLGRTVRLRLELYDSV